MFINTDGPTFVQVAVRTELCDLWQNGCPWLLDISGPRPFIHSFINPVDHDTMI
jgi:hypothetical protein